MEWECTSVSAYVVPCVLGIFFGKYLFTLHRTVCPCVNPWTVPVSHCIPVHPTSQVQVLGAMQVPPFRQELVQTAVIWEKGNGQAQICSMQNTKANLSNQESTVRR